MSEFLTWLSPGGFARFACDAAWHGALVGVGTWMAVRLCVRRPAVCAWLAMLALGLCVTAPIVSALARAGGYGLLTARPELPNAITTNEAIDSRAADFNIDVAGESADEEADGATSTGEDDASARLSPVGTSAGALPAQARGGEAAATIWTMLAAGWSLAATILGFRLFQSLIGVRRLCREAAACTDSTILSACRGASRKLGLRRVPQVLVTAQVGCPVVMACGRPRLFVPPLTRQRSSADWFGVFCHELAHVRRGDGWMRVLVELVVVALPWHPVVWLLRREYQNACEEACDDWALFAGSDPVEYASNLTDWISRPAKLPALGMTGRTGRIRRRIERLLAAPSATLQPRLGWSWLIGSGAVAGLFVFVLALLQSGRGSASVGAAPVSLGPARAADVAADIEADRRRRLPEYELKVAGGGDTHKAPAGLVAILGDSRLKHWNKAEVIGFDPTGRTVISAGRDRTVRFWSVATGREERTIESFHIAAILSPDRRTLFLGYRDGTVKLIDVATGEVRRKLTLPGTVPGRLAMSADGKWLAVSNGGHSVAVVDIATGKRFRTIKGNRRNSIGRRSNWGCFALTPDGRVLAVCEGNGAGAVILWDLGSSKQLRKIIAHPNPKADDGTGWSIYCLCFSDDGETLVTGGGEGLAKFWDVASGKLKVSLKNWTGSVNSMAFSPRGGTFATMGSRNVTLWNATTGDEIWSTDREFMAGHRLTHSLDFSSDGRLLAVVWQNRLLFLDAATGLEAAPSGKPLEDLVSTAIGGDGTQLAAISREGALSIWDLGTGQMKRTWPGPGIKLDNLAFSPDSRTIASLADFRTILLWEATTGKVRLRLKVSHSRCSFAFSPDGQTLALSQMDGKILLWDVNDGHLRRSWQVQRPRLPGPVAFGPHGRTLFSVENSNLVTLWDTETGTLKKAFGGRVRNTRVPLAISPDGRLVAVGTGVRRFVVWDVITEQRVMEPKERNRGNNQVQSLSFSPDGETLASAGDDGKVQLWNPRTRTLEKTLKVGPPGGVIRHVAFTHDGRHLVTANGNGTVYLLHLEEL